MKKVAIFTFEDNVKDSGNKLILDWESNWKDILGHIFTTDNIFIDTWNCKGHVDYNSFIYTYAYLVE